MRIAIADNTGLKFCKDLMDHWIAQGHEVRYERGASETLAQWADIYYVEWIDGNLNYLWKLYNDSNCENRTPDWDNNKKPKIICRMIDWDIWVEHMPFYDENYMNFIDIAVCIAPHIQKRILEKAPGYESKLILIRPGVNMAKFTPKKAKTDGFQLGMVLGDMWWPKNHMGGLDIFTTLYKKDPRWRLHIRGQHEGGQYWPIMYEEYLRSRGIEDVVTLYPSVSDMNEWYEKIDVLLHPGMKEAFCYAGAEAMAKEIPVAMNEFYGSRDIWPEFVLYQTHEEAIQKILYPKHKFLYREYIEKNYDMKRMCKEMDKLL
jgi:glycosyltransferase involved in cell wall biosynthesis